MFAVFHCTLGDREMMFPVCCNVNHVHVRTLAEFLISLFSIIDGSRSQTCVAEVTLLCFGTLFFIVTERNDFYPRNLAETDYC